MMVWTLEKYDETVNMSCRSAYILLYGWDEHAKSSASRGRYGKCWDVGLHQQERRRVGNWDDPLLENEDDGQDIESEVF